MSIKYGEITGRISGALFLTSYMEKEEKENFGIKDFFKKIKEIYKAVCEEKKLPFDKKSLYGLQPEIELTSEKVVNLFSQFDNWLETKGIYSEY